MGSNQSNESKETVVISAPVYHAENFAVSIATLSVLTFVALVCAAVYFYKKCKSQLINELKNSADITQI